MYQAPLRHTLYVLGALITFGIVSSIALSFGYARFCLEAIAEGFRHLGYKDDHALNAAEWIVYEALYAYCQQMVRAGKLDGDFK
jgi:hypothetical protein